MINVLAQRTLRKALQTLNKASFATNLPPVLYFAYGANMDAVLLERRGIHPQKSAVAELAGYEIGILAPCEWKDKGFASVRPNPSTSVHGVVYTLNPVELCLLDILEWVPFKFYRREKLQVSTKDNGPVNAYVYIACAPDENLKTSRGYRGLLVGAAKRLDFPVWYQDLLSNLPVQDTFTLDHGFRLSNPAKRRFLEKKLNRLYKAHDLWREALCQKLP